MSPQNEGSTKVPFTASDSGAALPRYRCIDDEARKREKEKEIVYNDAKLTRETGDKHVLSMRVSLSRSSDIAESDSSAETCDCVPFSFRFLHRHLGPPSPNRPRNRVRRIIDEHLWEQKTTIINKSMKNKISKVRRNKISPIA